MARIGYTTTSMASTADPEVLRSFLSSNLTTWTVGALQVFASANDERNYYVLSHNSSSAEILAIHCPGSALRTLETSVIAEYLPHGAVAIPSQIITDTLSFAFSPGGGYAARFALGDDPLTDPSFWPSDSTLAFTCNHYSGSTSRRFYFIEETDHAELVVYSGGVANNVGLGMNLMSAALINPTPGSTYSTAGMWHLENSTNTPSGANPKAISRSFFCLYNSGALETIGASFGTSGYDPTTKALSVLTNTNQPASDGTYLTREMGIPNATGQFVGILNNELALECGTMTSTYAQLRGPAFQPYVHLHRDFFVPWANGLALPFT